MQEIPAMRPPFFLPRIPQSGPGSLRISQRKSWVAVSPVCFFPLRRNQLVMLEPSPPTPPKKGSRLASLIISHFFPISGLGQNVQSGGIRTRVAIPMCPLDAKRKAPLPKLSADCRAFFPWTCLKCCRWFPSQGGFTDASMFLGQKVVRQGRSSGQTASWFQDAPSWPWLLQIFCCFRSCDEVRCVNCG